MAIAHISILITTHNRARYLEHTLQRLAELFASELQQGSLDILIFDDGSVDDTADVCRTYEGYVQYLTSPTRVGLIEARRRLATRAIGTYLVFLDDDSCLVDTDALDRIRVIFRTHRNCAVIAANVADSNYRAGRTHPDASPLPVGVFLGCGHVLRADVYREVGGYPSFLEGYGAEETALSMCVIDAGYTVLLVPRIRVYHATSPVERSVVFQSAAKMSNELGLVLYAYPLPYLAPALLYKMIRYTRYNGSHGSLQAVWHAARRFPMRARLALRDRHHVRFQTLLEFRRLQKRQIEKETEWVRTAASRDIWPETEVLFNLPDALEATGRGEILR